MNIFANLTADENEALFHTMISAGNKAYDAIERLVGLDAFDASDRIHEMWRGEFLPCLSELTAANYQIVTAGTCAYPACSDDGICANHSMSARTIA